MSSSWGKQKKSNKRSTYSSSSSSQYPTAWSEWDWDTERGCWKRYRYKTAEEYEIDYQGKETLSQSSSEPRVTPKLDPIDQQSGPYQSSVNYTTSPNAVVGTLSNDFSQLSTNEVPLSYSSQSSTQLHTSSFSQLPTNTAPVSFSNQDSSQLTSSTFAQLPTNVVPTSSSKSSTQLQSSPNHIRTRNPKTKQEEFNPDYRVHKAYEFKWGRVFKVLWAEPKGMGGQGSGEDSDASYTQGQDRNGATQFQKVRRFIIINAMKGHCICLPINTYSKQGVTKNGVHAEDHTVVYSEKKPVYFHGERDKGLTKKPIKIVCTARHKLDERSRLNYAKTYTVEYNVKVCFIGKIHKESEWHLTADFNNTHPPLEHHTTKPDDHDLTGYAEGGSTTAPFPFQYDAPTFSPRPRVLYDITDEREDNPSEYEQHDTEQPSNDYSGDEPQYAVEHGEDASEGQYEGSHHGGHSGH